MKILTANVEGVFTMPTANILYILATQSEVRGPAESASARGLPEVPNPGPHPRPTESEPEF